ncbi:MAG: HAMP domain-containing histidine kinase [Lachnospiraceae bacterium]|nr:HAMP domain-containing histidine kinase [Lachnospiraceae bacterium]
MKKGKNKTTPKRMKRQKFTTVFIKKTVFSLLICTMFCLIFSAFLMKDILAEHTSMSSRSLSDLTNTLTEFCNKSEEDKTFAINQLKWSSAVKSETGGMISVIYDLTTGEVIADSSRTAFLIVRDKNAEPYRTNSRIYTCDYTDLDIWKRMDQDWALKPTIANLTRLYNSNSWISIECDSYYLKEDGTFLPGKGVVYTTSDDYDAGIDENDTLIQTFDYTPEDISSYEKVSKNVDDLTIMGPLVVGYNDALTETICGFPFYPSKHSKILTDNMLAELKESGEIASGVFFSNTMFTYYRENTKGVTASNGQEYAILSASSFDLFDSFGFLLWPFIAIAYTIALAIAFISARFTYARLSSQYRMEDYRKMLMNTMAHDLKSPLMSISGYAENLSMNPEHPKRDSYLQGIQSGISYMNRTIEDILSLSKLEEHFGKIQFAKVDLNDILSSLIAKNEALATERNLSVKVTGESVVAGEATLVNELLDNLLTNALKHAPKGSEINISLSADKLTISNPCETDLSSCIDRLCEPFVTGDENRSDQKGSGLGLAIARNIAELLSYKMKVSYEDKTFAVSLQFKNKKKCL